MMKKALLAGVVATACAAVTMSTAGIAQASPPKNPNDCPNGYVCVWGDINYEGRYLFNPGTDRANVGSFMNDLTSSLWNRTGSQVCFYEHADFRGATLAIVPAGSWLSNVGPAANDKISSWRDC
ncbi:peptidase inhibitor family I36 protein [Actinomadura roseirufa]|uniref:peptidase inhibitor family I36 protein n=1 Tax=Actinomadura roseirufa TaxID=2094049 RepID=UPI0010414A0E|nr:peptidase inhibitor family I36 protein [Actinomadura roseirufa]